MTPLVLTLMVFAFASSALGIVRVRMPFSKVASAPSLWRAPGRVTERVKAP